MNAWEQREDESSKAYAAFVTYLELGTDRSIAKAAELLTVGKSSAKIRWFEQWSSRYDWVERVRAFDEHEFAQRLAGREQARERARQIAVDHAATAAQAIADLISWVDEERPSAGAKVRLEAAAKLLVLAGVDAPKRVEVSGPDGKPMEIDIRRLLADAIDQLGLDPELALELAEKLARKEEE